MFVMKKIRLVIFDVNQTMFSLNKIENELAKLGVNPKFCDIWFNSVLKEGFALNNISKFIPFKDIGISVLTNILYEKKIRNSKKISKKIMKGFNKLKPVDGLRESLETFSLWDIKMATLTNGNKDTTYELLVNNNLNKFITKTFSINDVGCWKPSPETYLMVTKHFDVKPENTLMVSCHSWDLEGAKNVGLQIGFINGTSGVLPEYYHSPDYQGKNILELFKNVLKAQRNFVTSI